MQNAPYGHLTQAIQYAYAGWGGVETPRWLLPCCTPRGDLGQ